MLYLYFFIILFLALVLSFNSFIKNTYYEYHQIYRISENYKENYKDPFF